MDKPDSTLNADFQDMHRITCVPLATSLTTSTIHDGGGKASKSMSLDGVKDLSSLLLLEPFCENSLDLHYVYSHHQSRNLHLVIKYFPIVVSSLIRRG